MLPSVLHCLNTLTVIHRTRLSCSWTAEQLDVKLVPVRRELNWCCLCIPNFKMRQRRCMTLRTQFSSQFLQHRMGKVQFSAEMRQEQGYLKHPQPPVFLPAISLLGSRCMSASLWQWNHLGGEMLQKKGSRAEAYPTAAYCIFFPVLLFTRCSVTTRPTSVMLFIPYFQEELC